MMNILRNRLRRIFTKLFILPGHGVEVGSNRKLSFTIFNTLLREGYLSFLLY